MSIKSLTKGIYTRLAADPNVATLAAGRIYQTRAPQDISQPYIIYRRIDAVPEPDNDAAPHLTDSRIEVSCVAMSLSDAQNLMIAVDSVLLYSVGAYADAGVQRVNRESGPRDDVAQDGDSVYYTISADYIFSYLE